jgi:hypothetical protein
MTTTREMADLMLLACGVRIPSLSVEDRKLCAQIVARWKAAGLCGDCGGNKHGATTTCWDCVCGIGGN